MKCGDVMAALRACPGGMPFVVKIDKEIYDEGVLELDEKGVSLVVKAKKKVRKK
jgi:hypothetical protein